VTSRITKQVLVWSCVSRIHLLFPWHKSLLQQVATTEVEN